MQAPRLYRRKWQETFQPPFKGMQAVPENTREIPKFTAERSTNQGPQPVPEAIAFHAPPPPPLNHGGPAVAAAYQQQQPQ